MTCCFSKVSSLSVHITRHYKFGITSATVALEAPASCLLPNLYFQAAHMQQEALGGLEGGDNEGGGHRSLSSISKQHA